MRFSSIGSGSRGNSTIIEHDDTVVLIDCGFSIKQTEKKLGCLGLVASDIDAILVTHEHSDHIRGVSLLAKKYKIPVITTVGTSKFLKNPSQLDLVFIDTDSDFNVGNFEVTPVLVPHDAREPVQFIVRGGDLKFGILTDVGSITKHIIDLYQKCDGLLIESNHDEDMLANGSYPLVLKKRVGGPWGHLNNKQMLHFLKKIQISQIQQLVIGHISENNNSIALVKDAISEISSQLSSVSYATQNEGFHWKELKN